ncbi:MAG: hypothetical protein KatS3mg109_1029 [Pirellulaceae bacterium]|nr:MAG: hypothetical protein KatS3mg109_1029 [Pirellulaceae bacterium]
MDNFVAWIDGLFKKTHDGRVAFFPWGVLGRGYVLPDDQTYLRIHRFVKRSSLAMTPIAIALVVLKAWLLLLFVIAVYYAVYLIRIQALIRGLAATSERLTVAESLRAQAARHSLAFLWVMEAFCILIVAVAGVAVLLHVREFFAVDAGVLPKETWTPVEDEILPRVPPALEGAAPKGPWTPVEDKIPFVWEIFYFAVGVLGFGFFALLAVAWGYMIRVKWINTTQKNAREGQ